MGDSNLNAASTGWTIIRQLCSFVFDRPAFWLLGMMYKLFFNVASANLFSNETILKFYGRVQLILGVFTMFQLAMSILKGEKSPKRDIVLLNAAAAIYTADLAKDMKEGIKMAEESIDSGKALEKLNKLVEFTNR